jgi:electron transport complex protein RnfG
MKSTLKNMVLVLFLITLFASGAVAVVYRLTEEPIASARAAKIARAIGAVVPAFDNDIAATADTVAVDGGTTILYTAENGGQPVGYAVQTFTNNGFSGLITLMVGFRPDGTIHGIEVLQHAETPGLGSKMTEPDNVLAVSFEGRNPADLKMSVRKDGGDIDALTASTITSRAYTDAVERAYRVFSDEVQGVEVQATTGATAPPPTGATPADSLQTITREDVL